MEPSGFLGCSGSPSASSVLSAVVLAEMDYDPKELLLRLQSLLGTFVQNIQAFICFMYI